MDAIDKFKEAQRKSWPTFAPFESHTTMPAARLVTFAGVAAGQKVLDVGCGTGVVAVTSALRGASTTGLDLTPDLLARAVENARIAGVAVEWHEGDAESLPFDDGAFDVVLSQFGHMFAPRPELATKAMLRVLRPGGVIAFSTWPPEMLTGKLLALVGSYLQPLPPGVEPPGLWGDPAVVRERLGAAVRDLVFDRATMSVPALSVAHLRENAERHSGPIRGVVDALADDPQKLAQFRRAYDALATPYFRDNRVRQGYLMTRAIKA